MLVHDLKNKKALSNLVAIVLLIAFTLAAGLFFSRWIHFVFKNQASHIGTQVNKDCESLSLSADVTYYPPVDKLGIIVTNTGSVSFRIETIKVFFLNYSYKSYALSSFVYKTLNPGDSVSILLNNIPSNVMSVRIVPTPCGMKAITIPHQWFHVYHHFG